MQAKHPYTWYELVLTRNCVELFLYAGHWTKSKASIFSGTPLATVSLRLVPEYLITFLCCLPLNSSLHLYLFHSTVFRLPCSFKSMCQPYIIAFFAAHWAEIVYYFWERKQMSIDDSTQVPQWIFFFGFAFDIPQHTTQLSCFDFCYLYIALFLFFPLASWHPNSGTCMVLTIFSCLRTQTVTQVLRPLKVSVCTFRSRHVTLNWLFLLSIVKRHRSYVVIAKCCTNLQNRNALAALLENQGRIDCVSCMSYSALGLLVTTSMLSLGLWHFSSVKCYHGDVDNKHTERSEVSMLYFFPLLIS